MTRNLRNVLKLFAGVLILSSLGACAQEVGDIDRTQPEKVKKSIFQGGEWYFKHTVVELQPSAGFMVAGNQSLGDRIYWEIQEDYLLARRAYEYRKNSEWDRTTNRRFDEDGNIELKPEGSILAAYRIKSHFDVQRQYNSQTGEQSNVLVENTSDRPWNEREYMRVDWSDSVAVDAWFDDYEASGVQYYVPETEVDNPDRPFITDDYIELVTKISARPETVYYSGYGDIPACWLSLTTDCAEQVLKVRSSFMRRTDDRYMFKPREWDKKKAKKFNILSWWAPGHSDELGSLYSTMDWKATIFNIWDDENQPMEFRRIRPVVWYLSANWPTDDEDIMLATRKTFKDWNELYKGMVKEMGYTGDEDIIILCENNPVKASDREECRTRVTHTRDADGNFVRHEQDIFDITRNGWIAEGDVRFNELNMVLEPQNYGRVLAFTQRLWDHQSGEELSSTIHMLYTTQEWWNSSMVDKIQVLNGDLPIEDYITGKYARDRIAATTLNEDKIDQERVDLQVRTQALVDLEALAAIKPELGEKIKALDLPAVRERARRRIHEIDERGGVGIYEQRRTELNEITKGLNASLRAQIEAESATFPDDRKITDKQLDVLVPLTKSPTEMRDRATEYDRFMSDRMMLSVDNLDQSFEVPLITPLVNRFKGKPRAEILRYFRTIAYYYTISHEFGHAMGLEHNFGGSTDALNFKAEYWLEKAKLGYMPEYMVGEEALKEKWDSNQELRANQYTSIMDYMSYTELRDEFFTPELQERSGLGTADSAAIHYIYADLVQAFDKDSIPDTYDWRDNDGVNHTINVNKDDITFDPDIAKKVDEYHYSYYPNFMFDSDRINISSRALGGFAPNGVTVDGTIITEDNVEELSPVLFTAAIAMAEGRKWVKSGDIAKDGLIEVPYRTCTNGLEDRVWWCQMHDMGVDIWERVRNHLVTNEFDYFNNYFARDRDRMYTGTYYAWMAAMREFSVPLNLYKHWLNRALIEDRPYHENWLAETNGGLGGFLASLDVLMYFEKYMAQPTMPDRGYRTRYRRNDAGQLEELSSTVETGALDPIVNKGRYYLNRDKMLFEPRSQWNEDELDMDTFVEFDLGDARYDRSEFDPALGYDYYYNPVLYGNWINKLIAIEMVSDPSTRFVGTDTGADTAYALNLATLFDREVFRTLANFASENASGYTQGVRIGDDGTPELRKFQDPLDQLMDNPPARVDAYIQPDESWTAQLYGLIYTTFLFDLTLNNPFAEAMNVMIDGEDRAIPEGYVEGDDYIVVPDLREAQNYIIFKHHRQGGLFVRSDLASPTWDMGTKVLDIYNRYGFHDAESYEEALAAAKDGLSGDERSAVESEFSNARRDVETELERFDILRMLFFRQGFRYPQF